MNRDSLAYGWFGAYDDNELELVSTISDPVKYRGGVQQRALGSGDYNLVALTGNIVRDDGRHEEYGGYRVGIRPDRQGGCLRLFVRNTHGDETEVGFVDEHNLILRAGPFALVFQGSDANFVAYDTRRAGGIGDPAAAVWSML